MSLVAKRCIPCEGGTTPLTADAADALLKQCPNWRREGDWIHRDVECRNFVDAVHLIQRIAQLAETEGHHPDIHLTGYRNLRISLQTHAISGLSENDFIVAAKTERILA